MQLDPARKTPHGANLCKQPLRVNSSKDLSPRVCETYTIHLAVRVYSDNALIALNPVVRSVQTDLTSWVHYYTPNDTFMTPFSCLVLSLAKSSL